MDRPKTFLTHYGVKGMTWENRKGTMVEEKLNKLNQPRGSKDAISQLLRTAKDLENDKTEYTVEQLTSAMDTAYEKVKKDSNFENLLELAIAKNRFETKNPDAYKKYQAKNLLNSLFKPKGE